MTGIPRRWKTGIVVALAVALVTLTPVFAHSALAHPLGNFTTNRYARIEVYRDRAHLHYVVDMAEIPTFQAMGTIDSDGDGSASEAELSAYAAKVGAAYPEKFELTLDGKALPVRPIEQQAQLLPGQGGLDVLRPPPSTTRG
jgi:hypothetical protein